MSDTHVRQVEKWFAQGGLRLSELFPELYFTVLHGTDRVQGRVIIQADGPLAGASISFWNKGDVEALALDKVHGREMSLDDRVLTIDDDVSLLLQSYFDRLVML